MTDPQRFWKSLPVIPQRIIDFLLSKGVKPSAIGSKTNTRLKFACGTCSNDGWFELDENGPPCIAFPVNDGYGVIDVGFWDVRTGATARLLKCGFAFGEEHINNPGTYSLGGYLKIHASPLNWLRKDRDGIFVLDWSQAFDRLRYCRRIAIHECLLTTYHRAMKPMHMPEPFVITEDKEAA